MWIRIGGALVFLLGLAYFIIALVWVYAAN